MKTKFTPGRYVVGPDAHGCFNTGHAPCILRLRCAGYVLLVGYEGDLLDRVVRRKAYWAALSNKRTTQGMWGKIYIYRTRRPAVARYDAMVEVQVEANKATRAKIRALRTKEDLESALTLGIDYGVQV